MKSGITKIFGLFAISLFGIALSLGVVELGFRITSLLAKPAARWTDRPTAYLNPVSATSLQGNVYTPEPQEDVFRIAVIGDSFTFAPFMQPDDAFPARLERFFQMGIDSGSPSPRIEVVNYGVPGYSTTHEVREARKAVKEGADLIVLQITLNDPQRKSYQPTGLTGKNEFGPYVPPEKLKSVLTHWKSLNYFLERVHNTETHRRYVEYYHNLFEEESSWNSFDGAIGRLSKLSVNKKVPLIAVVFPLFGVPLDNNYPFHSLHTKVASALQEREIPFLDLFETYAGIPLERLQVIPGVDFHPNEIGHRLAAEAMYHWFSTQSLIPQRFFSAPQFAARTDIRLLQGNKIARRLENPPSELVR